MSLLTLWQRQHNLIKSTCFLKPDGWILFHRRSSHFLTELFTQPSSRRSATHKNSKNSISRQPTCRLTIADCMYLMSGVGRKMKAESPDGFCFFFTSRTSTCSSSTVLASISSTKPATSNKIKILIIHPWIVSHWNALHASTVHMLSHNTRHPNCFYPHPHPKSRDSIGIFEYVNTEVNWNILTDRCILVSITTGKGTPVYHTWH